MAIAIVAVLLAILIPALGGAKEISEELQITTHLHGVGRESVLMYAEDRGGALPYYGVPGTNRVIEFPLPFGSFEGQSYGGYWFQHQWWNAWVHTQGYDGTRAVLFPDIEHELSVLPGAALAMMTQAAFAEPRYFSGEADPAEALSMHHGQRLTDVRSTSKKALLMRVMGEESDAGGARWHLFFADGHAWVHDSGDLLPGVSTPHNPFPNPVLATKDGIHGRDVR